MRFETSNGRARDHGRSTRAYATSNEGERAVQQEDSMMIKKPEIVATVVAGAATLGLLSTLAFANHVSIRTSETVVVPGTAPATQSAPVIVVPPAPPQPQMQTLRVEDIRANVVRAQTIYANEIDADQIQGMVHQTKGVKVRDTKGELKAPEVAAPVIYADSIKANSVIAEQIHVRDLRLNK
jgi:hypothetical protein